MEIEQPMKHLSIQQRQEADRLFRMALQCSENKDYEGAAAYYGKAAAYGHPGAQNNLGYQFANGRGVNKNPQEAFRLYVQAARQGNTFGMRNAANCCLKGIGTDADFDAAIGWLTAAAERKDDLACVKLVNIYGSGNHRDPEKKLYWLGKSAECGNPESMFALGEYYARQGEHQDLSRASAYYENAAENGGPDMKLKVAKSFDFQGGVRPAIDIQKAQYWYNEVLMCGEEQMSLEAARGLDEKKGWNRDLIRPALDITKAFMTYRTLAMQGNKDACALSAYCYATGKGTAPNLELAAHWYEESGDHARAEWCRRKKSGDLSDSVYEHHLHCCLDERPENHHLHGKEYYGRDLDFQEAAYNGRMYYIRRVYGSGMYLCSSDMTGDDVKVMAEIPEKIYDWDHSGQLLVELGTISDMYVHVNSTGIYLYATQYCRRDDQNDIHVCPVLFVRMLDLEGVFQAQCQETPVGADVNKEEFSSICIYDRDIYYVHTRHVGEKSTSRIMCMHIGGRTEIIYEKGEVERVFASDKYLVFYAEYENEQCMGRGWMLLNLDNRHTECISNPYCNPEDVIDHPEVYDSESPVYNDKWDFDRNIVFFDLAREIFWVERPAQCPEGDDLDHLEWAVYWEPRALFKDRDAVPPDMPVWKIKRDSPCGRIYFDGTCLYFSEDYYHFKSLSRYGDLYNWNESGHGACERFRVLGNCLFLDMDDYRVEGSIDREGQYPLSVEKPEPFRKSWFGRELPQTLIDQFHRRADSPAAAEKEPERAAGILTETERAPANETAERLSDHETEKSAAAAVPKKNADAADHDLSVEKTVGNTDMKYNICTLGAKFHIGFRVPVTIRMGGNAYACKTHATIKGRIDGMKKLYTENGIKVGDVLRGTYLAETREMILEKL